jgi:uncharacterized protein (DUF1330 family)
MPAYFVLLRELTGDQHQLDAYHALAPASGIGHSIVPRAVYGALTTLEGPAMEAAAILEFPTVDDAKGWYESTGYQEALAHRKRGSTSRAFIIEGT